MQGKRHSRGNVAVAALLFVAFVGVAAVALVSVRPQVVESKLSQAPAAADKGTNKDQSIKCEAGYDYDIKIVSGKTEIVKRYPILCTSVRDDFFLNPITMPLNTTATDGSGRICSQKGWSCRLRYCRSDTLTPKNSKGVADEAKRCIQLPRQYKVGNVMTVDNNAQEAIGKSVGEAGAALQKSDATTAEKQAGQEAVKSVSNAGDAFNKGINSAFDTAQETQKQVTTKAYDEYKNLEALAGKACAANDSVGCEDLQSKASAAQAKYDAEKSKLEALAKSAQGLKDNSVALTPGTPGANPYTNLKGCDSYGCYEYPNNQAEADALIKKGFECGKDGSNNAFTCFRDADKGPIPKDCNSTFGDCNKPDPGPGNPGPGPSNSNSPTNSSGGGMGDIMKSLGQFAPLIGQLLGQALQGQKPPTCTLKASPTNITRPGQPVTISWTSQNAQQAYLSASGQVGPTGQMTVNPQQTTSYTMQVVGYPQQQPQQQYNPYAQQVQQDAYCVTSINPVIVVPGAAVPGCANYKQAPGYGANPYGQQPQQQSGPPQQGQCQVQVTVGQGSGGDDGDKGSGDKPKAQISCQPKIADVGMSVSISYACQNATASKGEGFSTGDKLSGSASADVKSPEKGSTTITYGLTCTKDGATDSAQCTVNVNKPSIVLVANPKNIDDGEKTNIGWVTGAMESCVVSSPDLSEFTEANKNNTSTSGSAKTPPLQKNTKFVLTCTTKAGGTKTAETTVEVD